MQKSLWYYVWRAALIVVALAVIFWLVLVLIVLPNSHIGAPAFLEF